MVIAAAVLLPWLYVAAWLAFSRSAHHGTISGSTVVKVAPAFGPIRDYSGSDLPGSRQLYELWWRLNPVIVGSAGPGIGPSFVLAPRNGNGVSLVPAPVIRNSN